MNQKRSNKRITAIFLIMIFMLSFTKTGVVLADEETPVEPAPQVEQSQEQLGSDPVVPAQGDPDPASLQEPEQTLPATLEELPEDTDIIVVAEDGQIEPLATQTAANTILEKDPMWCPDGATDGNDCYNGLTINDLFNDAPALSGGGTLYFMSAYNGDDLMFDHDDSRFENLGSMKIQGGWDGVTTGAPNFSGYTTLIHQLTILNWVGNLTINNIIVQTNTPDEIGIVIGGQTGNITINESGSSDNNVGMIIGGVNGDVSINDGNFSENLNAGFEEHNVTGTTSISDSSFTNNGAQGSFLSDVNDVKVKNSEFDSNGWEGLTIEGGGDVMLDHVQANGNQTRGEGWANTLTDVNNVTISDSQFKGNSQHGLNLDEVFGMVTITNSHFDNNQDYGLALFNIQGEITITCSSFKNNQGGEIAYDHNLKLSLNGVTQTGEEEEFNIQGQGPDGQFTLVDCKKVSPKPSKSEGRIVPVNGGENIPLDCGYAWTMLVLPNGDHAKFLGICDGDVQLTPAGQNELPGVLLEGDNFGGAFTTNYLLNGITQQIIPNGGVVNLSFLVPEELEGKDLSILYWDTQAGKWIDIPVKGNEDTFTSSDQNQKILKGMSITDGGYATATVNFNGLFVLVSR